MSSNCYLCFNVEINKIVVDYSIEVTNFLLYLFWCNNVWSESIYLLQANIKEKLVSNK